MNIYPSNHPFIYLSVVCLTFFFVCFSCGLALRFVRCQVFDLVNREAFNQSFGVNVTGIREHYLQLSIGQGNSVFISLASSGQDDQTVDGAGNQDLENAILPLDTLDGVKLPEENSDSSTKELGIPDCISCEIYLQQIFHENVFSRAKDKPVSTVTRVSSQPAKEGSSLLGHFCMSLAHRIFSKKVLRVLENLVFSNSSGRKDLCFSFSYS